MDLFPPGLEPGDGGKTKAFFKGAVEVGAGWEPGVDGRRGHGAATLQELAGQLEPFGFDKLARCDFFNATEFAVEMEGAEAGHLGQVGKNQPVTQVKGDVFFDVGNYGMNVSTLFTQAMVGQIFQDFMKEKKHKGPGFSGVCRIGQGVGRKKRTGSLQILTNGWIGERDSAGQDPGADAVLDNVDADVVRGQEMKPQIRAGSMMPGVAGVMSDSRGED